MVSGVPAKSFTVELQRVQKTGTMFRVPFDLEEAFGCVRPPVKVTIRNHTWRTTPGVYGGVGHIVVNRAVKAGTGVDAVEGAKRPETRTRRIAATVARVRDGKPHR
jgi:hypothetical protein